MRLWWEGPWPCCGIGQKQWLLGDQSQAQHMCGCVFDATDAGKPFCGLFVFYIYTHDIFTFRSCLSPSFSFCYPQAPVTVRVHVCVYVPPWTLGFPSGVYVWVQLTFCTYVPHPRSRGSHFSISYQHGSTSRKKLHYSIMAFSSSSPIYWVSTLKRVQIKSVVLIMWDSTLWKVK